MLSYVGIKSNNNSSQKFTYRILDSLLCRIVKKRSSYRQAFGVAYTFATDYLPHLAKYSNRTVTPTVQITENLDNQWPDNEETTIEGNVRIPLLNPPFVVWFIAFSVPR